MGDSPTSLKLDVRDADEARVALEPTPQSHPERQALLAVDNVLVSHIRGVPDEDTVTGWLRAMHELSGRWPHIAAVIVVDASALRAPHVWDSSAGPTARDLPRNVVVIAGVLLGNDPGALVMRAAWTTSNITARWPFPYRIHRQVPDATAWVRYEAECRGATSPRAPVLDSAVATLAAR